MRADRLRSLREQQDYTQEELAGLIGETSLQVWRWENERNVPNSVTVAKIAKALGVSADYLLGLSDDLIPDLKVSDLSLKERAVIAAWRSGNVIEAVRVIMNDEQK